MFSFTKQAEFRRGRRSRGVLRRGGEKEQNNSACSPASLAVFFIEMAKSACFLSCIQIFGWATASSGYTSQLHLRVSPQFLKFFLPTCFNIKPLEGKRFSSLLICLRFHLLCCWTKPDPDFQFQHLICSPSNTLLIPEPCFQRWRRRRRWEDWHYLKELHMQARDYNSQGQIVGWEERGPTSSTSWLSRQRQYCLINRQWIS